MVIPKKNKNGISKEHEKNPKKNRKLTIESEKFYQANTKITAFSHCIDQILTCLLFPSEYWVDLGKRYVGPRRVYRLPPKCKERKDAMKNIMTRSWYFSGRTFVRQLSFCLRWLQENFVNLSHLDSTGRRKGSFNHSPLPGFIRTFFSHVVLENSCQCICRKF